MLNERAQAAHDPTITETAQGLSLAFEKLKADISQSRAARFVLAVLEKLKGAIQMEKDFENRKDRTVWRRKPHYIRRREVGCAGRTPEYVALHWRKMC